MAVISIDHIQLAMPKGREDEARAFYHNILGVPEVPKPAELSGRGGAWFERGTVKIHLGVEDNFRPAKKAHPALIISNLDELVSSLRSQGYEIVYDKSLLNVERAFTHDPFGNRVELIQHVSDKRI